MPRDWDAYYQGSPEAFDPAFVVRAYGFLLPEGEVLDLAGGTGRNAFFLACRGHRVFLLEKSPVAVERVRAMAQRRRAAVHALVADLEAAPDDLPPGPFTGVVVSYFVSRPLMKRLAPRLKPGGLVLVEGFNRSEALRRGRPDSPHYWEPGELMRPPGGLELLAAGEGWQGLAYRSWAVWRRS
ncbi:class I SAM-dependent methyltransferase [Oceanithermus desulfurans]|uniref:Methyltransferase n=2 Tax=Oceanithermus desulfurans TaxID=227924 RepID=A0A511RKU5_9DEIN|nr:class I SAM-dependent methyltransferase [Oceanithermus desulfurans]MBB6028688.1 SAM-dependent methyltransferase [Oceanithermus desulfurans]GEM90269.1 methyltransferase [Oceanithermus desulfurans NBRC 100063]